MKYSAGPIYCQNHFYINVNFTLKSGEMLFYTLNKCETFTTITCCKVIITFRVGLESVRVRTRRVYLSEVPNVKSNKSRNNSPPDPAIYNKKKETKKGC